MEALKSDLNKADFEGYATEIGMGSYHGKASIYTFSHRKSVLKKSNLIDIAVRYSPYDKKLNLLLVKKNEFCTFLC